MLAAAGFVVEMLDSDQPLARTELLTKAGGCDAILANFADRIDAELLDSAGPSLKIVANLAVGYDNIDLAACRSRGVVATNTPGVLTDATADLTWALILAAARRLGEGERMVRAGRWNGWTPTQLLGMELSGAKLGIVGAGRIGTAVALRSQGFRMRVLYSHPRENEEIKRTLAARRCDLDELLAQADVVSLHTPMRPENRHLLDGRRLSLMKSTAILINTSRGPIIDEVALLCALRENRIAAAGLDVYECEPSITPGLIDLENVVLLPHLGSATHTTRCRMSEIAATNILAALQGRNPPNAL
jgi:glyoxylate reductase